MKFLNLKYYKKISIIQHKVIKHRQIFSKMQIIVSEKKTRVYSEEKVLRFTEIKVRDLEMIFSERVIVSEVQKERIKVLGTIDPKKDILLDGTNIQYFLQECPDLDGRIYVYVLNTNYTQKTYFTTLDN